MESEYRQSAVTLYAAGEWRQVWFIPLADKRVGGI